MPWFLLTLTVKILRYQSFNSKNIQIRTESLKNIIFFAIKLKILKIFPSAPKKDPTPIRSTMDASFAFPIIALIKENLKRGSEVLYSVFRLVFF